MRIRPTVAAIAAISMLGIGIFSFLAAGCIGISCVTDTQSWCIAAQAEGTGCPTTSALAFLDFHINALKSFSAGVLKNLALAALLYIFFAYAFFTFAVFRKRAPSEKPRGRALCAPPPPPRMPHRKRRWLVLRQKRDPDPLFRTHDRFGLFSGRTRYAM